MSHVPLFGANPLDRAALARRDAGWLRERLDDPESRFLPLWKLDVLIKCESSSLAWARRALCDSADTEVGPVLLGLRDGVAHFAVDLSPVVDPIDALGLDGVASFEDLRAAAMQLDVEEAGIVAQARSLVQWHSTHRFCARCGERTASVQAGAWRVCGSCKVEHFPRVNPVAIMLVVDGERCLLGRQRGWPEGMYSALAGFIEPGETMEAAVRREVLEESGVTVGDVRYVTSQPWPFPCSLMMGCVAEAETTAVTVDDEELEDVQWFDREQVRRACAFDPGAGLMLPPKMAIGHYLASLWSAGASPA